jgi:hypothetical protein
MTTQKAVGDILKNLICDNGKLVIEAPVTAEKVEVLKNTILQNAIFEDKGVSLPPITDAMITQIAAGGSQCQTAIDGLVKDVIGTTLKEEFNDLVADTGFIDQILDEIDRNKPTLTATTITPASCGLNNGSVKLSATGGTPPYQYSKDGITFQTSDFFENLAVDTYTIIVKDNIGKTASTSVTISKVPPLSLTATSNNVTCISNNGSISLTANGGKLPYLYSFDGISATEDTFFDNLKAGNYNLSVQDDNGCTATVNVSITEPESYEVEPSTYMLSIAGARLGEGDYIMVQFDSQHKATKFKLTAGYTYSNGILFANGNIYIPYFYTCDLNIFAGFYKENCPLTPCTPTLSINNKRIVNKKQQHLCKECWIEDAAYSEKVGAWVIKNKWNLSYINQFKNSISVLTNRFKNQNKKVTCDDFGLELIVTFAMENNLPFRWKTGAEDFDAELTKYSDFNSFLLAVKRKCGAPDFANNSNTLRVNALQGGDLVVLTHTGKPLPNHIQVIYETKLLGNILSLYYAYQGNFNRLGRYLGSDDPESIRYLGIFIQDGIYGTSNDIWINNTEHTVTEHFFKQEYKHEFRSFNFLLWN